MSEVMVRVPISQFQRLMKACSTLNQCGHYGNPDCECYRESSKVKRVEVEDAAEEQESMGC